MKDKIRHLLFWVFVAPLMALLLAPAIALLTSQFTSIPHQFEDAFQWAVRACMAGAAPCSGLLCLWCWFNWDDEDSNSKAGVFMVGAFWLLASLYIFLARASFVE